MHHAFFCHESLLKQCVEKKNAANNNAHAAVVLVLLVDRLRMTCSTISRRVHGKPLSSQG